MEPDAITATTVTFKLTRTTLKNIDDAAGLWQFESGHVSRKGEKVANYSSTKRVTFGGTDSDGQNAATVNTTFLESTHNPTYSRGISKPWQTSPDLHNTTYPTYSIHLM